MGISRRIVAAIALSVVAAVAAAGTASAVTTTEHHFNMYGNLGPNRDGYPVLGNVDVIQFAVGTASPRPLSVSLNEVCFTTQLPELDSRLGGYGYTRVRWTARTDIVPNCGQFGNVLYHLGPRLDTYVNKFVSQDGSIEVRGWACAKFNVFLVVASCTAHTDNDDTAVRQGQNSEYYNQIAARYPTNCRYTMGDLNDPPGTAALNQFYAANYEAMSSPVSTTDDNVKLDYIFGNKTSHSSVRSYTITPLQYSDHHYYQSSWTFTGSCV